MPGGPRAWERVEAIAKALGDSEDKDDGDRERIWRVALTAWRAIQKHDTEGTGT